MYNKAVVVNAFIIIYSIALSKIRADAPVPSIKRLMVELTVITDFTFAKITGIFLALLISAHLNTDQGIYASISRLSKRILQISKGYLNMKFLFCHISLGYLIILILKKKINGNLSPESSVYI